MDITRATILEKNINNNLSPELVLIMTYVKIRQLTKAMQNASSYKTFTQDHPNSFHFWILNSIVYIFLHKEEQSLILEM